MKLTFTVGRLIFGGFFIYNGITHFLRYKSYAQYAATKKVPLPEVSVLGTGSNCMLLSSACIPKIQDSISSVNDY
jgi:uncharacterized membrane protein YphA (DoxX/SURF4 family)